MKSKPKCRKTFFNCELVNISFVNVFACILLLQLRQTEIARKYQQQQMKASTQSHSSTQQQQTAPQKGEKEGQGRRVTTTPNTVPLGTEIPSPTTEVSSSTPISTSSSSGVIGVVGVTQSEVTPVRISTPQLNLSVANKVADSI